MTVMIQVRNVPDSLHRELVRRADARGMSLTAYVQGILEREVERPSPADIINRLKKLDPMDLSGLAVEYIREDRGPLPK